MTETPDVQNDPFEQAGDWRVRRARGLSPAEAERFRIWHSEPVNASAYERVARSWAAFEAAMGGDAADNLALASMRARALRRGENRGPSRRALFGQIAAGVAIVAIGAGGYRIVGPMLSQTTYAAGHDDVLDLVLADGSHLTLDAGAVVKVRMDRAARDLALVKGRARFAVAHDAQRPMTVDVGGGVVTVLGTIFNVDRGDDGAVVTLVEGSISASAKGRWLRPAGSPVATLKPGEQVAIGATGLGAVHAVDTRQVSIWPDRTLHFSDVALGDAVARVNRYADVPVVLAEPAMASLRISGSFDHGDAGGFADGVGKLYGLQPLQADGRILMQRVRRFD